MLFLHQCSFFASYVFCLCLHYGVYDETCQDEFVSLVFNLKYKKEYFFSSFTKYDLLITNDKKLILNQSKTCICTHVYMYMFIGEFTES